MGLASVIASSGLGEPLRLDAEYYTPENLKAAEVVRDGVPIRELVDGVIHPQEVARAYVDDGVQVVLAQHVRPNRLDLSQPVFMPESYRAVLHKNELRSGDLVMTRTGANYGDVAAVLDVPRNGLFACADLLILRRKTTAPAAGYLSSYFASEVGRRLVRRGGYGGGQPHIAPPYVLGLRVPSLGDVESEVNSAVHAAHSASGAAARGFANAVASLIEALGLDDVDVLDRPTWLASAREVVQADRFDAAYFNPKYQHVLAALSADGRTIDSVAQLARDRFTPSGEAFEYIEIGGITATGLAEGSLRDGAEVPDRAQWLVRPGDVITSTVRPIRRLTAIVMPEQDGAVCSSGFAVLRSRGRVPGELLLAYLRIPVVAEILDLLTSASMYPALTPRQIADFPFPSLSDVAIERVAAEVQRALSAQMHANAQLEFARSRVDEALNA